MSDPRLWLDRIRRPFRTPPLDPVWSEPVEPFTDGRALSWLPDPQETPMPTTPTAHHSVLVEGSGELTAADLMDVLTTVPADAKIALHRTRNIFDADDYAPSWSIAAEYDEPLPTAIPGVVELGSVGFVGGCLGCMGEEGESGEPSVMDITRRGVPVPHIDDLPVVHPEAVEFTPQVSELLDQLFALGDNVPARLEQAVKLAKVDISDDVVDNLVRRHQVMGPDEVAEYLEP